MYLLIVLLPMFVFSLVSISGRFFGTKGCILLTNISMLIVSFLSLFIFYEVGYVIHFVILVF